MLSLFVRLPQHGRHCRIARRLIYSKAPDLPVERWAPLIWSRVMRQLLRACHEPTQVHTGGRRDRCRADRAGWPGEYGSGLNRLAQTIGRLATRASAARTRAENSIWASL